MGYESIAPVFYMGLRLLINIDKSMVLVENDLNRVTRNSPVFYLKCNPGVTPSGKRKRPTKLRALVLLVPVTGIELVTFALRIGTRTVCHDLKSDGSGALTTREIHDLMALQGQKRRD